MFAFQIKDDLLDLETELELANLLEWILKKMTLPLIHLLGQSNPSEKKTLEAL